MTDDTGLPASFEMAWGIRDRPRKGPRRGLSLEQIVDAGIRVANAEGIGGVSMSRVANELGTSAMSLYRYVAAKDELLWLMIDGAFGQVEFEVPVEGTWRERLEEWAAIELRAYRQFPWVVRIPVSGAPIMPNQLRFMEWGLRALGDTKLAEGEKLSVILLLTSFTRSFALLSGDLAAAFEAGDPLARAAAGYGRLIKTLTTVEEFPALHAVVDSGVFEDDEFDGLDSDFHFGLERILDGVAALVALRE
ncbi:TetR/AcrR family transcriptional regulator [Actinophytocola oryzae]|uniref:TetR family transcriptional regulator n=1 Tax=Actinophytocola oryzae TaxID=502181 RepID=A0A4R7VQN1_9PSEU|nr:TetR/AcrR family transcriptional regulator [Actinophytocola oryzae]TDV51984.1 TetR family transcriptional regulator [Actinophytocola oryzae]